MGAPSKRARKIRTAREFDTARLAAQLAPPKDGGIPLASWTLEQIFAARDDQLRGTFLRPARMAESMRTDDALAVAFKNRLAPQRAIAVAIKAASGARAEAIAGEAEGQFGPKGIAVTVDTLADIHGAIANHGFAVGVNATTPREDGSRIDFLHKAWPLEYVRWDPVAKCLKTRVDPSSLQPGDIPSDPAYGLVSGHEVPIIHGDGRWVIYSQHEINPWTHGALLSAAAVWGRHAYGNRDWTKSSAAHGNAKIVGEMPEGVALQDENGSLTKEAAAFLELLKALGGSDVPIGIRPAKSKTDFLANGSTAWQVFNELVVNAEKAAARIYLGTDGTLGAQGGAPGVDLTALFGVATTIVQGDLGCIERGLLTGVIEPWTAINFGDSKLAPTRKYLIPDADADAVQASHATRRKAFWEDVAAMKANGCAITQEILDKLAREYKVTPPTLASGEPPASGQLLRAAGDRR